MRRFAPRTACAVGSALAPALQRPRGLAQSTASPNTGAETTAPASESAPKKKKVVVHRRRGWEITYNVSTIYRVMFVVAVVGTTMASMPVGPEGEVSADAAGRAERRAKEFIRRRRGEKEGSAAD